MRSGPGGELEDLSQDESYGGGIDASSLEPNLARRHARRVCHDAALKRSIGMAAAASIRSMRSMPALDAVHGPTRLELGGRIP
jgi:hypothetical protein